jgi:hypothetical protein
MNIHIAIIIALTLVFVAIAGTLVVTYFPNRRKQWRGPSGLPQNLRPPFEAVKQNTGSETTELNIVAIKLRSQVTSMQWFIEMLMYKEYGHLNFAQLEMLGQIRDACKQSVGLLNELFDNLNTRSPGTVKVDTIPTDVSDLKMSSPPEPAA